MPLVLTILCPPLLQEGAVGMVRLPLRGWRCSQSRACTTVTFSSESHKVCSYFFWLHCAMVKCFAFMEEGRHRHRKDFSVRETSTKTHLLLVNLSSFAWWTEPRAPDALRHVGLWLNGCPWLILISKDGMLLSKLPFSSRKGIWQSSDWIFCLAGWTHGEQEETISTESYWIVIVVTESPRLKQEQHTHTQRWVYRGKKEQQWKIGTCVQGKSCHWRSRKGAQTALFLACSGCKRGENRK